MSELKLYGLSRSVYTRIALLALEEKRLAYTLEEVEIFSDAGVPAFYLKLSPFGRIPTLIHNRFILYETGAIIRYIDEAFSGPNLQPTKAVERARMNQIISLMDAYAYYPMIWDVFVQRIVIPKSGGQANETLIREALPTIRTCLDALETLIDGQPFFIGDKLTLADLHVTPVLLYFMQTPEGEQMLPLYANLSSWLSMIRERRSIETTKSIFE